ncbi:MAG: ATP-dependent helicase UvrD/PcrA [Patescibacteria group bacterium]|nr:ATP-dependent helicase UvrD/PcrA [Patescibacteria group bacterium]
MVKKTTSKYIEGLNKEQRAAVCHTAGPAMVIAGAGTGKTKVITSRIAYLIEQGLAQPEEILALTFTEKAAAEMEERVDKLLPYGYVDTNIKTFHALGYEILQDHGFELGLPPNLKVISSLQQHILIQQVIEGFEAAQYFRPAHNPQQFRSVLLQFFSRLKDEGLQPLEYLEQLEELKNNQEKLLDDEGWGKYFEAARIYELYQKLLQDQGFIDYGDQLLHVYNLLQKKQHIRKMYQKMYKFVLVDEYQDTNRLQAKIVNLLLSDAQNLMVVGDDDQSIYRFRGADLDNMLGFKTAYPATQYYSLTENYRSSQHIVDVAYALIQHNNPARLEVQTGLSKKLHAQTRGRKPTVEQYSDNHEEFHAIATDIQRRDKAGEALGSMAILCRNNAQTEDMIHYLQHLGIPVATQANGNLLHIPVVRQCIDFVRVLHDEEDSAALYRYLVSPKVHAPTAHVMELSALAQRNRVALSEVIVEKRDEATQEFNALKALEAYREIAHNHTIGEILYRFITDGGYLDSLAHRALQENEAARSVQQLAAFFTIVKEFEAVEKHRDSYHFWSYIQDMYSSDVLDEVELLDETQGVHVLTTHRSKGLEFETVYLYDMTEGNFPATRRSEAMKSLGDLVADPKDIALRHENEERRLMYVAMTRAKKNLILTFSLDHGGKRARKPSRFLLEAFGPDLSVNGNEAQSGLPAILTRYGPKHQPGTDLPAFPVAEDGYLSLTPNQIADYLADPSRFYVRHVLRFPSPPSHQMVYGISVHAALEYFYTEKFNGRQPDLSKMLEVFRSSWRSEGFVSLRHEVERRKQGEVNLSRYFAAHIDALEPIAAVEKEFNLTIEEIKVNIRGRYDLVVKNTDSNGVSIRDFKTSHVANERVARDKVRDAVQMGIYALAWDALNDDKTTSIALYFTESQLLAERTKIEHEKTLKKIAEAVAGIRAAKYPRRGNLTDLETEGLF